MISFPQPVGKYELVGLSVVAVDLSNIESRLEIMIEAMSISGDSVRYRLRLYAESDPCVITPNPDDWNLEHCLMVTGIETPQPGARTRALDAWNAAADAAAGFRAIEAVGMADGWIDVALHGAVV